LTHPRDPCGERDPDRVDPDVDRVSTKLWWYSSVQA